MQRFMLWITGWGADNWLTVAMLCSLIIALTSDVKLHAILAEAFSIITGLIGLYLLFRLTKARFRVIWRSTGGKIAFALFSLLVITGARIMADYQITVTTGASAALFPRAQDLLTLLMSTGLWFALACLLLAMFSACSHIYWMVMLFISDLIESSKARARAYIALKLFSATATVLFVLTIVTEKAGKVEFNILEHAIVISSFVPNQAIPLDLGPSAVAQLCPSEPADGWLAIMGDGTVMVALPATSETRKRAFTYRWGQCGGERQPGALSSLP